MSDIYRGLIDFISQLHGRDIDLEVRDDLLNKVMALPDPVIISEKAVDPARARAAQDLCTRVHRVLQSDPMVWSVSDLIPLINECGVFISFYAPEPIKPSGQLPPHCEVSPEPSTFMLPVDKLASAEVLMLFRAFVIKNVTQWVLGAGDHHHPIWEQVAVNVEGDDPANGPRWTYIQPLNRKRLSVLELEYADMMDERQATERGG